MWATITTLVPPQGDCAGIDCSNPMAQYLIRIEYPLLKWQLVRILRAEKVNMPQ